MCSYKIQVIESVKFAFKTLTHNWMAAISNMVICCVYMQEFVIRKSKFTSARNI